MNVRNASRVKWAGMAMLSVMTAGCVINPYVKAPTDSAWNLGSNCWGLENGLEAEVSRAVDAENSIENQSIQYAICTQRAMERKAGKYAWMNNGGALLLMHMAGLASYSGSRGGHTAQVTSMTTGGATFYGAQQYLYRKPREAIYWMGSEAMMCAISFTRKRLLTSYGDNSVIGEMYIRQIDAPYKELDRVRAVLSEGVLLGKDCTQFSNDEKSALGDLASRVRNADDKISVAELDSKRLVAKSELSQIIGASRSASSDLVDVTSSIRLAVNRQLAAQQPDPAELSRLLTGLKSPTPAAGAVVVVDTGKNRPSGVKAFDPTSSMSRQQAKAKTCSERLEDFQANANVFIKQHQIVQNGIDTFNVELARIKAEVGVGSKSDRPMEQCLQFRGSTLGPFRLMLAQAGPIELKKGEAATIPIGGGVPPFRIESLDDGDKITVRVTTSSVGGYQVDIVAGDTSTKGHFFASDSAGGTAFFSVAVK